jgi:hypothetical protein
VATPNAAPVTSAAPVASVAAPAPPPAAPGHLFSVYRVDDAVDPLVAIKDVPDGIELRFEKVPAGDPSKSVRVTYAFARVQSGEKPEAAADRLRTWAASVPHPFATWFTVSPVDTEADAGPVQTIGFRTLLVRDPVVVDERDVTEAKVDALASGRPVVRVSVRADAAARLELATREWVARRLAVVAYDIAVAAPLILEPIGAGRATVPAVGPTDEARRAWAERLAKMLGR